MEKIKHREKIYEIENFITKKHQSYLLTLCKDENWNFTDDVNNFWYNKKKSLSQCSTLNEIDFKIQNLFSSFYLIHTILTVQRFMMGQSMSPHKDISVDYTILIYINDDYEGGEIFFPDINFEYKPKERSLLMYPGSFTHGVKSVGKGSPRYSLTTFAFKSNNIPLIIK